jgi:hypothetical protein
MPLKLTELRKATRPVTFSYSGEDVTVVYKPGMFTADLRLRMIYGSNAYVEGDAPRAREVLTGWESYHADLAEVLVSWDVLGEDGKPCKPTAALLAQFPQSFINALVGALVNDQNVNPQTGKDSKDTSQPTG